MEKDKKIVEEDQKTYFNTKCGCGHARGYHDGIGKYCYVSGCKCMNFVSVGEVIK